MYLDSAEERAEEGIPLYIKDWRAMLTGTLISDFSR
jgi:hypothetical protein